MYKKSMRAMMTFWCKASPTIFGWIVIDRTNAFFSEKNKTPSTYLNLTIQMRQFSNQIGGQYPNVPWGQTSSERIPLFSDPPFLIKSTFVLDWSNLNTLVVLRFFDDLFQIHRETRMVFALLRSYCSLCITCWWKPIFALWGKDDKSSTTTFR